MHNRMPRTEIPIAADEVGQGGGGGDGAKTGEGRAGGGADEARAAVEPAPAAAAADERARPRWPAGPFVATCVDPRHPTLLGRVKVRLAAGGGAATGAAEPVEWWVPTLHGHTFRAGDRLLLHLPVNAEEPIVVGVIDGFLPRPELPREGGSQLVLERDEALRVQDEEGQPLVEIIRDERGPVVRLLQTEAHIELAGKLCISAAELELRAVKGQVRIEASDQVTVVGETIKLN
jgi:hypothetical protein